MAVATFVSELYLGLINMFSYDYDWRDEVNFWEAVDLDNEKKALELECSENNSNDNELEYREPEEF